MRIINHKVIDYGAIGYRVKFVNEKFLLICVLENK